jgi:DNA-binding PadR family transcriptional regulator
MLEYTVLGLVIEKPSYGYEIYERFERRFGHLVDGGSQSNIYAILKRLQSEAMIEQTDAAVASVSEGRPRIYYRATGSGASTFRGWLAERMRDDRERSELLSRLAATGMRRVDAMLEVIDRYEEECLQEARRTARPEREGSSVAPEWEAELMEDLLLEERRRSIAAQLSWIEYARDRVRAYASQRFPGA